MSRQQRPLMWRRAIAVGLVLFGAGGVDAEITGRWRIERGAAPPAIVDITQTNTDVMLTYEGILYSGDFIDGRLRVFGDGAGTASTCGGYMLGGAVSDNDNRLHGGLFDVAGGCVGPFAGTIVGERCECADGNDADGDGCDAACRVEPCFACPGEPSVCAPIADGGGCDDGLDCTAGEVCTSGACGGGTAVAPCFDLSGPWRWWFELQQTSVAYDERVVVSQRDGYVTVFREGGDAAAHGPIDPTTGAFDLASVPLNVKDYLLDAFCVGEIHGQPGANQETVAGDATGRAWGATMCGGDQDSALSGERCRSTECPVCTGDCDNDRQVVVNELVTNVNIALERAPISQCFRIDGNGDRRAEVSELITAVNISLRGCPE